MIMNIDGYIAKEDILIWLPVLDLPVVVIIPNTQFEIDFYKISYKGYERSTKYYHISTLYIGSFWPKRNRFELDYENFFFLLWSGTII